MARHHKSRKSVSSRQSSSVAGVLLREDRSKHANLPTEIIMRDYDHVGYPMDESMEDTYMAVERQLGQDASQLRKAFKPSKP